MGTSSMTYVYHGGQCRIACLGGCDGYPSGEGVGLLGFVSNKRNLLALEDALPRCRNLDMELVDWLRRRDGIRWEETFIEQHPEYVYWSGAMMLEKVISIEGEVILWNRFEDRRLDDWAYVIDLDSRTFEVYKGWTEVPPRAGERFAGDCSPDEHGKYPFNEVAVFSLDDLPSVAEFLEVCER